MTAVTFYPSVHLGLVYFSVCYTSIFFFTTRFTGSHLSTRGGSTAPPPPQKAGTTESLGVLRAFPFGRGSRSCRPSPFSEQRKKLSPDQGSPRLRSPAAWPTAPARQSARPAGHVLTGRWVPGAGRCGPDSLAQSAPSRSTVWGVGRGAWGVGTPGRSRATGPHRALRCAGESCPRASGRFRICKPLPRPQA